MGSLGEIPKMRRLSKTSIPPDPPPNSPSIPVSNVTQNPKAKGFYPVWGGYLFLCWALTGYQIGYMHVCPSGLTFFQNLDPPPPTQHFLKVNNYPDLIMDDFKILSIHNQTLLGENNKLGCLSKFYIKNYFILKLCYLEIERKKK
jgi:hypothetical protein